MNKSKALEIYTKYLSSTWPKWDEPEKKVLPIGNNLLKSFLDFDKKYANNNQSKLLSEALSPNFKGRLLFWSDPHFFHNNIIRYCNRPFNDMFDMNDALIKNYFNNVKDDDIVVWAGDIAFSKITKSQELFKNIKLPGKKILVLGNHDFEKNERDFRDVGIFDEISLCEGFSMNFNIDGQIVKKDILLSHYPIDKSLLPENVLNFHGHIHDAQKGLPWVNLGVEITGFKPILAQECFDIASKFVPDSNNDKKVSYSI